MNIIIVSFLGFLGLFTLIGVLSSLHKKNTTDDYLVAGRSVSPWLTALSAVATNNSGFMFIGMISFTYRLGIQTIWMMVGWILGDLTAWLLVYKRLRFQSEKEDVKTVPALMGTRDGRLNRPVMIAAGMMTFVFLSVYAAAQLKAGSFALHTLFGWDMAMGAIIGTVIVIAYCFAGGIRASIWTDAAQSIVMIMAMAILLIAVGSQIGGPASLMDNLHAQDPSLVEVYPADLQFGFVFYLMGMIFGGFGAVGQPHILVRFMAIRSTDEIRRARVYYFLWFIPFFMASIAVGLYARAFIPDISAIYPNLSADTAVQLAMPELAKQLLPGVLIGLTLAGLFAATMSTADSQILTCSAALTQDIVPRWRQSYFTAKVATLLVAGMALSVALFAERGVGYLVLFAWSAMGAGLGPLVILRVFHRHVPTPVAIAMMITGVTTVVAWSSFGYDDGWGNPVFNLFPGMIAAFAVDIVIMTVYRLTIRRPPESTAPQSE